ncbi:MAG: toll/interleukin-1 receptor domain-containing protein [Chloroflexi bacterium]|nr:toll/interleukin-1 receptor domain-containing protein [Chloroflexota bacterium]
MSSQQKKHIYISYSQRDEKVKRRVVAFLQENNFNLWAESRKRTSSWETKTEQAISQASSIIVLLSPNAKSSKWVRREITLAEQYKVNIYPVLIKGKEEDSIFLRLITNQYIDLRGDNEEQGLHSLYFSLSTNKRNSFYKEINNKTYSDNLNTFSKKIKPILASESIVWLLLIWSISWILGLGITGVVEKNAGMLVGGAFIGLTGGLGTSLILRQEKVLQQTSKLPILLITFGWGLAWGAGFASSFSINLFGFIISTLIGGFITAYVLDREKSILNKKAFLTIALSWTVGAILSLGFSIVLDNTFRRIIGLLYPPLLHTNIPILIHLTLAGTITGLFGGVSTILVTENVKVKSASLVKLT